MKNPEKVKVGERLAEYNCRKREERTQLAKAQSAPKLTYHGTGAVVAIGTLGALGYCIYRFKEIPKETPVHQTNETLVHRPKEVPDHKYELE